MKKLLLALILPAGFITIPSTVAKANAIAVSGVTVNQAAGTVTFNLGWDNSFWDGLNWDAAWVFVKYRNCNDATQEFQQGEISTTMTQHSLGSFQATNASGVPNVIDAAPNNRGIMLRRGTLGMGNIVSAVTLRITNLPVTGDFDVRVYAIEMVYIPQSSFFAGDGTSGSFYSTAPLNPAFIASEAAITLNTLSVAAGFPKGYNAFYIMKYEISQGQYADFLNGCSMAQSVNRYPLLVVGSFRFQVTNSGNYPQNYISSRPDRAINYLNWDDLTAYLDWAALRPMTELQFEKACRGGTPSEANEHAWGSTTVIAAIQISGIEDGTEVVTLPVNANCNLNNLIFTGGDGGAGPLRCGIFATAATTTRLQTGASFWGVMELSGNVYEQCIHIGAGVGANASANGVGRGDGELSPTGQSDDPTWPTAALNLIIFRGGSFASSGVTAGAISYRDAGSSFNVRAPTRGGRGIR